MKPLGLKLHIKPLKIASVFSLVSVVLHALVSTFPRLDSGVSNTAFRSFELLKARQYVPLLFDTTRHIDTRHLNEFGNAAFAPALCRGSLACNKQLFVFIRASVKHGGRWGAENVFGILNMSALPLELDLVYENERRSSSVSTSRQVRVPHRPSRELFHELLANSSITHKMYGNISDSLLWVHPLCRIPYQLRDVRLFFVQAKKQILTCAITVTKSAHQLDVICLRIEDDYFQEDDSINSKCAQIIHVTHARHLDRTSLRNNVPLVSFDPGNILKNENILWLFDAMGSKSRQPFIYPINLNTSSAVSEVETLHNLGRALHECASTVGWRGSTSVVQFTDRLWITMVHKRVDVKRTRNNTLGRLYVHKIILLEADPTEYLPYRCKYDGESEQSVLLDESDLNGPFAFLLGLVHIKLVLANNFGSVHRFLISGSVDDFQPVVRTFDIFIPAERNVGN